MYQITIFKEMKVQHNMIKKTFKENLAYCFVAFFAILSVIALLRYERSGIHIASIIEFYIPLITRIVFASIILFFAAKYKLALNVIIFINALCMTIEHLFELNTNGLAFDAILEDIILALPFILIMLSFLKPKKYVLSVLTVLAALAALYSLVLHITIVKSFVGAFSAKDIKEYLAPTVIYNMSALFYWISAIIYNVKKEAQAYA